MGRLQELVLKAKYEEGFEIGFQIGIEKGTERIFQLFKLLKQEKSIKEIVTTLDVSENKVIRIKEKLGL